MSKLIHSFFEHKIKLGFSVKYLRITPDILKCQLNCYIKMSKL